MNTRRTFTLLHSTTSENTLHHVHCCSSLSQTSSLECRKTGSVIYAVHSLHSGLPPPLPPRSPAASWHRGCSNKRLWCWTQLCSSDGGHRAGSVLLESGRNQPKEGAERWKRPMTWRPEQVLCLLTAVCPYKSDTHCLRLTSRVTRNK